MRKAVDVSSLKPTTNIFGDCPEGTGELRAMTKEARRYMLLKDLGGRFNS